jgi:hypothetical protein
MPKIMYPKLAHTANNVHAVAEMPPKAETVRDRRISREEEKRLLDAALLSKVPIVVELKSPSGVFDKGRDAFASEVLVPVSPARVTLRARTMCRGSAAAVFVRADIRRR